MRNSEISMKDANSLIQIVSCFQIVFYLLAYELMSHPTDLQGAIIVGLHKKLKWVQDNGTCLYQRMSNFLQFSDSKRLLGDGPFCNTVVRIL